MKKIQQLLPGVMILSTLVIVYFLAIWDQRLNISSGDHILLQVICVSGVFFWVAFWAAKDEYNRLKYETPHPLHHPVHTPGPKDAPTQEPQHPSRVI